MSGSKEERANAKWCEPAYGTRRPEVCTQCQYHNENVISHAGVLDQRSAKDTH
jgi:hypothetical protein